MIGRITKPWGLKGGVVMLVQQPLPRVGTVVRFGAPVAHLWHYAALDQAAYQAYLAATASWRLSWHRLVARPAPGQLRYQVHMDGLESRTQAEECVHAVVLIQRDELRPTTLAQCWWSDLYGCEVYDDQEVYLGRVRAIDNYGATDIAEVVADGGGTPAVAWILPLHDGVAELKVHPEGDLAGAARPAPRLWLKLRHSLDELKEYQV